MHITDESRLRDIVGHPMELIRDKARNSLADVDREWLAESPMVFLATADELGRIDVSPKGDPAGKVVHVIDDRHIAIPERPGNRRVDGYVNILRNPNAGTIFVVPGRGDTLRINGRARIVDDADYFDDLTVSGKRPILAVEITVDEVLVDVVDAVRSAFDHRDVGADVIGVTDPQSTVEPGVASVR